jgi:N-acetylornithine carbamoyltransferase
MNQLGGHTINLTASSDFWELEAQEGSLMDGRAPEHVKDAALVLSRYVDALAIRPALGGQSWSIDRRDTGIRAWAEWAQVPVINMESAMAHPLQALADLMTLRETLGNLGGKRLAITWTHSTTPASSACRPLADPGLAARGPRGARRPPRGVRARRPGAGRGEGARRFAPRRVQGRPLGEGGRPGSARRLRPLLAVPRGLRQPHPGRHPARAPRRLDGRRGLMRSTENGKFMHAMPVRRNVEVSDEVLDGPRSLVVQQAENRLHSQKALLARLLAR